MASAPAWTEVRVTEDTSMEKLQARELGSLIRLAKPWLLGGVTVGAGAVAHAAIPGGAMPYATAMIAASGVGLSAWSYAWSRLVTAGRLHSALTVAAVSGWLDMAAVGGAVHGPAGLLAGIAGPVAALSWNLRGHAVAHPSGGTDSAADRLKSLFVPAAAQNGIKGVVVKDVEANGSKISATVQMKDGKTAAALANAMPSIESSAAIPPGTVTTAASEDRADEAQITLSDPRILKSPVPWPGASRPGGSMAAPLRIGAWQDAEAVEYILCGHHLSIMGASGSGKSIGGAWNLLGEAMTRYDSCLLGIDITKRGQTFGPMRAAFHKIAETPKDAAALVRAVEKLIGERTEALAAKGLQKWEEGCGLSYLILWIEEAGDVFAHLSDADTERLINIARALRSGGGSLIISVQRNTYDQVPTIIRGQMASMCFGLNDPNDAKYGLSPAQQQAEGVEPAEWGIRHPGKAYLDAPTIPEERITMPLRTYAWGDDDDIMREFAANWPAPLRPADAITAAGLGLTATTTTAAPTATAPALKESTVQHEDQDREEVEEVQDEETETNPVDELLEGVEDPSPDITEVARAAGPDAPIGGDGEPDFDFADVDEKLSPEESRQVYRSLMEKWRTEGRKKFRPAEIVRTIGRPGMQRPWIQARLKEDVAEGVLVRADDEPGVYAFA